MTLTVQPIRSSHSAPPPPPPPREGKPLSERIRNLVLLATAFLTFHSVLNATAQRVNPIERADVYAFWHDHYFPTAIKNSPLALEELTTDNFKQLPVGEPVGYRKWWNRIDRVEELTVSEPFQGLGQQNKFDVHWVYYYKNDPEEGHPVTIRVHMTCDSVWAAYAPLGQCDPQDVRLDDDQAMPR
jgi:hypothetical protein